MTTHAELVAAAEKARADALTPGDAYATGRGAQRDLALARNAHVDDLLAILRLHTPVDSGECAICAGGMGNNADWPCETVQIVADRLTGWGVL